jgi:hypothetical protein
MMKIITFKLIALLLFFNFTINSIAQKSPCDRSVSASVFPEDTTIVLPSGTTLTFNRCEYFDSRNCIEIKELTDTSDLRRVGLNMVDENGKPLLTSGMLKVALKNCGKTCFEIPIKIKAKVRFKDCYGNKVEVPPLYFSA